MNKREAIHKLIDALIDLEETGTKKTVLFSYWSQLGFDFNIWEGNGSKEAVRPRFSVYDYSPKSIESALKEIELIKTIPDTEPKVQLTISKDKARELGLIA